MKIKTHALIYGRGDCFTKRQPFQISWRLDITVSQKSLEKNEDIHIIQYWEGWEGRGLSPYIVFVFHSWKLKRFILKGSHPSISLPNSPHTNTETFALDPVAVRRRPENSTSNPTGTFGPIEHLTTKGGGGGESKIGTFMKQKKAQIKLNCLKTNDNNNNNK